MNVKHIIRIIAGLIFTLFLTIPALGIPGIGGPRIPDPPPPPPSPPSPPPPDIVDDVTDIIDDFSDIAYIIENPSIFGFGMGTDSDPITTSLDDAVYDAPFLDSYPYSFAATGMDFQASCRMPRGGDGYHMVVPGRYEGHFETFCLHAGTHGPGGGDGYLYAPLKGPWAHIIQGVLKTSELHPEISQSDVQYLLWALLGRARLSDMSEEMQTVARVLMTSENIGEINAGAFEIIPHDQTDAVFEYFDMPPEVERVMRAESEIRRLATSGGSFEEIEAIAVLSGNPLLSEDSRDVPLTRWSYHPDGYFIRYEPHGYSRTDFELVMPDNITIEISDRELISSISDEHGSRIDIDGDHFTFTCPDIIDARNLITFEMDLGNYGANVTDRWVNEHRSEVQRLVGDSEWVDYIVELGKLAHSFEPTAMITSNSYSAPRQMADLACEAWMYAIISVNLQDDKDEEVKDGGGLPDFDWRDRWRPVDPSGGTATPGNTGRQRLGGRHPRPTEDDWGTGEGIPDYKPSQNPEAHSARDGMSKFNSFTDKLGYLENGLNGTAISAVGFAIPNAVFGGLVEFALVLWDYCIGATNTDPPRPDFDIIAERDNWSFTPLTSPADGPPERVAALNNFLRQSLDAIEYMTAAVMSVDRHGGAVQARDEHWAFEQAKVMISHQRQAGWETYEAADALDNLIAVLNSEGWDEVYVTADSIRAGQDRLRSEGLSTEQLAAAEYFEFTDSMKQAWMDYLLSIDPDASAGSVMDAARNFSSDLRTYATYLVNLPDATREELDLGIMYESP